MAVRSRRLAAGTAPASATTVLYQVPADRTLILRSMLLEVATPGAGTVTLSMGLLAGVGVIFATTTGPAAGPWINEQGLWIALNETDQIRLSTPANITVDYWLSGSLLQGDPA